MVLTGRRSPWQRCWIPASLLLLSLLSWPLPSGSTENQKSDDKTGRCEDTVTFIHTGVHKIHLFVNTMNKCHLNFFFIHTVMNVSGKSQTVNGKYSPTSYFISFSVSAQLKHDGVFLILMVQYSSLRALRDVLWFYTDKVKALVTRAVRYKMFTLLTFNPNHRLWQM